MILFRLKKVLEFIIFQGYFLFLIQIGEQKKSYISLKIFKL